MASGDFTRWTWKDAAGSTGLDAAARNWNEGRCSIAPAGGGSTSYHWSRQSSGGYYLLGYLYNGLDAAASKAKYQIASGCISNRSTVNGPCGFWMQGIANLSGAIVGYGTSVTGLLFGFSGSHLTGDQYLYAHRVSDGQTVSAWANSAVVIPRFNSYFVQLEVACGFDDTHSGDVPNTRFYYRYNTTATRLTTINDVGWSAWTAFGTWPSTDRRDYLAPYVSGQHRMGIAVSGGSGGGGVTLWNNISFRYGTLT
jgi:hypothetical protein